MRTLGRRGYILALVPHWDRTNGDMEIFVSGLRAFQRHADIAMSLRASGWTVVAYTGRSPFRPDHEAACDRRAA
jgi:hypothetical protein